MKPGDEYFPFLHQFLINIHNPYKEKSSKSAWFLAMRETLIYTTLEVYRELLNLRSMYMQKHSH